MSDFRLAYAPLALLITIPTPSYGQAQLPQAQRHQGQGQRPQGQATQRPPQRPQGQAAQRPPQRPQGQATQRPPQQPQLQHRASPNIETYRGPQDYRAGSRPSWNVRRRYQSRNLQPYRREYRAERRFHIRPYVRLRGWYPYQWWLGGILPRLFWSQSYWITSYWLYGLPIPPYDCVWVRYENDALLIDRRTGEIVQVIYDIFY